MSADRPAASDGGACGFPVPGVWSAISSPPIMFPACVSTHAPWHRKPGHETCPSSCDVDWLSSGVQWGRAAIPRPIVWGRWPLHFPGRALCVAPFPWPFCDISGVPLPAMSIDRWGPHIGQEQHRGPAGDRPSPLRASAGDPTPNTSVKGMYSGEIESGSRPGNCDSRPRNCSSSSS